jgi:hypothetical protein
VSSEPAEGAQLPACRRTSLLASEGDTAAISSPLGMRSTAPARRRFMSPSNAFWLPR